MAPSHFYILKKKIGKTVETLRTTLVAAISAMDGCEKISALFDRDQWTTACTGEVLTTRIIFIMPGLKTENQAGGNIFIFYYIFIYYYSQLQLILKNILICAGTGPDYSHNRSNCKTIFLRKLAIDLLGEIYSMMHNNFALALIPKPKCLCGKLINWKPFRSPGSTKTINSIAKP